MEKAAKELRLHRAELAKRKKNRGEGRSGPALDSILGASGKVDVERAQAVLSAEKTARRGEEAIREGIVCLDVEPVFGSGEGRRRASSRRRGVIITDEQLRMQQQKLLRLSRKEAKPVGR